MEQKLYAATSSHIRKSGRGEAHTAEQIEYGDGTVADALDTIGPGIPGPQGEPGIDGVDATFTGATVAFDKAAGTGIKVDTADPQYPWKDLLGQLVVDESGLNAMTLATYRGNVREYRASVGDKVDLRFHMPHDYAPGTDLFIHFHWSHVGTAITGTGTIEATFEHVYSKGHQQADFTAPETVTITNAGITTANTPQYHHRIEEVQLSGAGGTGGLLDTALLEPDGLLLANFTLTAIPTITGGSTAEPFIHAIDIHYQTTGINTAQKSPDFYA